MSWEIKDKELRYKKCFAILPRRIGDYIVWFSPYYKTWDMIPYWGLSNHLFIHEKDVIEYIERKRKA